MVVSNTCRWQLCELAAVVVASEHETTGSLNAWVAQEQLREHKKECKEGSMTRVIDWIMKLGPVAQWREQQSKGV